MIGEKVIDQQPVCLAQIEQMMEDLKKNKELNYEQDLTLKYAKKFAPLTAHQAEKATDAYRAIAILSDQPAIVVKLLDFVPTEAEFIEVLIGKTPKLSPEDIQAIIDVSKKFKKE